VPAFKVSNVLERRDHDHQCVPEREGALLTRSKPG
jgi:hypothetical protein